MLRFIRQFCRSFRNRREDPPIERLENVGADVAWTLKQHNYHRVSDIQAASVDELAAIPVIAPSLAVAIYREAAEGEPDIDLDVETAATTQGDRSDETSIEIDDGGVDVGRWR